MGRSPSPKLTRSLSPVVRQEIENLDKDADSRKSALRALKLYVKDLDSKAIPVFLAQVSETKHSGTSSGEHTISLYEVLARVHGPKIVPEIDNIMRTIVQTLSLSSGAFALHQACSKVVPAIARYAINPTTAEDKKKYIIHSLCKPLSDCLLSSQDNTSCGAALCLQALVESDNWRFASSEMVNEVCQRVAGALEKHAQTNSLTALVAALAKHNGLIVEAYARLLIRSGLRILDDGFLEANSQKQLSAIHMINSLMRSLDPKSILSELDSVMKEMEKCQSDRLPFVARAAVESLQLAKKLCAENGMKLGKAADSATCSNGETRANARRRIVLSGDQSPFTASPESCTVNSSVGYNYFIGSPNSINQGHEGFSYERSVNRKLWPSSGSGILDVSLNEGIFSDIIQESDVMSSEYDDFSHNHENDHQNSAGFVLGSTEIGDVRSSTPSPERVNARINIDDVKIFSTPRRLIRSLQDQDNFGSDPSKEQAKLLRIPTMSKFAWTPTSRKEKCVLSQEMKCENSDDHNLSSVPKHFDGSSESVSSTDVFTDQGLSMSMETIPGINSQKKRNKSACSIASSLCVALFAAFLCLLAIGNPDDGCILVPT